MGWQILHVRAPATSTLPCQVSKCIFKNSVFMGFKFCLALSTTTLCSKTEGKGKSLPPGREEALNCGITNCFSSQLSVSLQLPTAYFVAVPIQKCKANLGHRRMFLPSCGVPLLCQRTSPPPLSCPKTVLFDLCARTMFST